MIPHLCLLRAGETGMHHHSQLTCLMIVGGMASRVCAPQGRDHGASQHSSHPPHPIYLGPSEYQCSLSKVMVRDHHSGVLAGAVVQATDCWESSRATEVQMASQSR